VGTHALVDYQIIDTQNPAVFNHLTNKWIYGK